MFKHTKPSHQNLGGGGETEAAKMQNLRKHLQDLMNNYTWDMQITSSEVPEE